MPPRRSDGGFEEQVVGWAITAGGKRKGQIRIVMGEKGGNLPGEIRDETSIRITEDGGFANSWE